MLITEDDQLKKYGEPCILEDRLCTECGECDVCDLDPTKKCDNCCQCIKTPEGEYAEIQIDDILINTEDKTMDNHFKGSKNSYKIKAKGKM